MNVGSHPARVVVRVEDATGEFVETELLGPRELDDAVHGLTQGNLCERSRDVIGCLGLNQHGGR